MSTIAADMRQTMETFLFPRTRYARLTARINAAVDRYAAKKSAAGQQEFRWITIGGASGDKGEHEGGTPVKIEKATGKIVAGPKALADKGVEKLSDFGKKDEGGATTAQRPGENTPNQDPPKGSSGDRIRSQYKGPESVANGERPAGFTDSEKEFSRAMGLGLYAQKAGQFYVYSKEHGGGAELAAALSEHGYGKTPQQRRRISELAGYSPEQIEEFEKHIAEKQGATTAQQGDAAGGLTEAEAKSRKWKKNDDGTYTAPNGTVWKKAGAGGEESPVNGKLYAGGHLMPIHGQSAVKVGKGDGASDPVDLKAGNPDNENQDAGNRKKKPPRKPDKTRDRMGDLVTVPEGHRAIEKILAGSPAKSRNLNDDALAYLGLTKKQSRDLADIWERDGGAASIPEEIVPPSHGTKGVAPTDDWDIAAKFGAWKESKAKEARAKDADMSQLDENMKPAAPATDPTPAKEPAVPKTDPKSPKAGDVYDFPAVGDRSPVGLRVSAVGDSHVGVGMKDSDQTWVKIPKESFHSFVQDMSGKIDVPETDDPHISRIRSGEAKMLGRGDDGLVFDTGDGKVTKVSTTTPFQPLNPFHRTPDEAKKRAIDQFNTAKALHQAGVPGIPRMSAKEHGDRVFTTRENLKIPEKLTADQLRQTRDSLRAMHDQGYSLNDEVQVGIGADGKVYHFDLGKAAKAEHPDDFKGDQDRLDRLAEKSGLPRIAINPQKEWGEYKGMLDNRKASDERRQQQVKDGVRPASQAKSLVEDFRRIVGENLARLRDQMVSENPSDADRIRAEHAEMMGEAAPATDPTPAKESVAFDDRLKEIKSREAKTPKAKRTISPTTGQVDQLRDLLREDFPGASVKLSSTKNPSVNIYPPKGKRSFSAEEHNTIRHLLRNLGYVDQIDGLHRGEVDYGTASLGNLVLDADGPHPDFAEEGDSQSIRKRKDKIAKLSDESDRITSAAVSGSGFTKHTDAKNRRVGAETEKLKNRPGSSVAEMMGEAATPPAAPVPQSPPPKPTVAGTQSGLFDRDEMTTGQKSLFNVVRPAKGGAKKPVAPDLLAGVTADVRAHLERKGTLSPADVSGTSLQAESLEGQKEMFSRIRGAMSRGVARYRLAGGSCY